MNVERVATRAKVVGDVGEFASWTIGKAVVAVVTLFALKVSCAKPSVNETFAVAARRRCVERLA